MHYKTPGQKRQRKIKKKKKRKEKNNNIYCGCAKQHFPVGKVATFLSISRQSRKAFAFFRVFCMLKLSATLDPVRFFFFFFNLAEPG